MANLSGTPAWSNIYQLESTDDVQAGAGGISNRQAENLLDRTLWLRENSRPLTGIGAYNWGSGGITIPVTDRGKIYKIDYLAPFAQNVVTLPDIASASVLPGSTYTFISNSPVNYITILANPLFAPLTNKISGVYIPADGLVVRPYEVVTLAKLTGQAEWQIIDRYDLWPASGEGTMMLSAVGHPRALLCNGGSYGQSGLYGRLYATIGTTYGGVGSNFNVPNVPNQTLGGILFKWYIFY